jgi:hypothetical protein
VNADFLDLLRDRLRIVPAFVGRDSRTGHRHSQRYDHGMASVAVQKIIEHVSGLSEEERRVVVDAIAPAASTAQLADEWEAEIARRAARVRGGVSQGRPADEVFDRLERKLPSR